MIVEIQNDDGSVVGEHNGHIYRGDKVALLEASELLDRSVRDMEDEQS